MRAVIVPFFVLVQTATTAAAQSTADLIASGRGIARSQPAEALRFFEQALAIDSTAYEASWRAAVALVDIAQELDQTQPRTTIDSLYLRAERYARSAIRMDSTDANGHFALAMTLGRIALGKGKRDRLSYAAEIHRAATRAAEIDPNHDGAQHVLGLWNLEAMRLSGFSRFMAKNILGGKVLGQASWDGAVRHLERAVAIDPARIYHRLDLAVVYVERKRYREAIDQLVVIDTLTDQSPADARHRRDAAALRGRVSDKVKDGPGTATSPPVSYSGVKAGSASELAALQAAPDFSRQVTDIVLELVLGVR